MNVFVYKYVSGVCKITCQEAINSSCPQLSTCFKSEGRVIYTAGNKSNSANV